MKSKIRLEFSRRPPRIRLVFFEQSLLVFRLYVSRDMRARQQRLFDQQRCQRIRRGLPLPLPDRRQAVRRQALLPESDQEYMQAQGTCKSGHEGNYKRAVGRSHLRAGCGWYKLLLCLQHLVLLRQSLPARLLFLAFFFRQRDFSASTGIRRSYY